MRRLLIVLAAVVIGFWGYRQVQGQIYHRPIQPDAVLRVEIAQQGPDYRTATAEETAQIIAWFNRGDFRGVNASLAGPGCSAIALFIYVDSGQRIGISVNGEMLEVSQGREPYFLRQTELLRFIRDQQPGCR